MNEYYFNVGVATPEIKLADVKHNVEKIMDMWQKARKQDCDIVVFPDLVLTGATCGDLLKQNQLLDAAIDGLFKLIAVSSNVPVFVGLPVKIGNKIYKCTAIISNSELLGLVPKNNLTSEEQRVFSSYDGENIEVTFGLNKTTFGNDVLLKMNSVIIGVADKTYESVRNIAYKGANIVIFTGSTPIYGDEFEKVSVQMQTYSRELDLIAVCPNIGLGESTTDYVYSGKSLVFEKGNLELVTHDFEEGVYPVSVDISHCHESATLKDVSATVNRAYTNSLYRYFDPHPFVPPNFDDQDVQKILYQQAYGLAARMKRVGSQKTILGLSGGLDSAWALVAACTAMNVLGKPYTDVICVSMPCFGTSHRTKSNAELLANAMGCSFREIDISESVGIHLRDIGHDLANQNTTYENAQARERTQVLMDLANDEHGIVVGTGDLSEIALGWCTYNGDQMSMYNVNASIPKTMLRSLMTVYATTMCGNSELEKVLLDIVDTPISPELLPPKNGEISQKTEDNVGSYELIDFFIYHTVKNRVSKGQLMFMALNTRFDKDYSHDEIVTTLNKFYIRFINSQFKRSCSPDGPQVTEVSLSPRGGWMMPSDAYSDTWN